MLMGWCLWCNMLLYRLWGYTQASGDLNACAASTSAQQQTLSPDVRTRQVVMTAQWRDKAQKLRRSIARLWI